jgi:hypothetical protein
MQAIPSFLSALTCTVKSPHATLLAASTPFCRGRTMFCVRIV